MVWTFFPNSGGAATIIAAQGFNPGSGALNYGRKGGALAIEFSPLLVSRPEYLVGPTRYSFSQVVLSGDHPVAPRHPSSACPDLSGRGILAGPSPHVGRGNTLWKGPEDRPDC